jgi:hypothetical protein
MAAAPCTHTLHPQPCTAGTHNPAPHPGTHNPAHAARSALPALRTAEKAGSLWRGRCLSAASGGANASPRTAHSVLPASGRAMNRDR